MSTIANDIKMKKLISRKTIYETIKKYLLKYTIDLQSETFGIEKIDFSDIININEISDLLLDDKEKGTNLLPFFNTQNTNSSEQTNKSSSSEDYPIELKVDLKPEENIESLVLRKILNQIPKGYK